MASLLRPSKIVGIAMNTWGMSKEDADRAIAAAARNWAAVPGSCARRCKELFDAIIANEGEYKVKTTTRAISLNFEAAGDDYDTSVRHLIRNIRKNAQRAGQA